MRRPTETNKRLKPFSPEIKPPPGAFAIALCGTFLLAGALSCQYIPDNDEDDEDTLLSTVLAIATSSGPV
ncbi:MAG: hypothetical protein RIF32_11535 [Leptospirales bacterium]